MDKPTDRQVIQLLQIRKANINNKRSFVFYRTGLRFKRKFNYKTL